MGMIPVRFYLFACVLVFHPKIFSQTRSYSTPWSGIIPDLLFADLEDVAFGIVALREDPGQAFDVPKCAKSGFGRARLDP